MGEAKLECVAIIPTVDVLIKFQVMVNARACVVVEETRGWRLHNSKVVRQIILKGCGDDTK